MIFSFLMGVLTGAGLVVAYGTYQMIQLKKNKSELIGKLKDKLSELKTDQQKEIEKGQSIKDRLMMASRLADAQMEIRAQAEMPSKNSLHSRYKNGLVSQINELEAEKLSILRSVLGDGFNPTITVMREGGVKEEISLSDYVAQSEELFNTNNPAAPGSKEEGPVNGPRKAGKFVIYTGGKNDDGTTH